MPSGPAPRCNVPVSDPDRCPPDPEETAEQYIRGTLSAADARVFEDHVIGCARCSEVAEKTEQFIRAMRSAARQLTEAAPR